MAKDSNRKQLVEGFPKVMRRLGIESILWNQALAERLGLNLTDLTCLNILGQEGAMTAGKLAEHTALTTGAITGVIDRLEKGGFVERAADPNDRRRVVIQPVSTRAQEVGALMQPLTRARSELYEGYSDEELQLLFDFLQRMNQTMVAARAEVRNPPETAATETGRQSFKAPIGSAKQGRLVFGHGASHVVLKSNRGQADLVVAQYEGIPLKISADKGVVMMQYSRPTLAEAARYLLGGAKHTALVSLTGKVPWELEIKGGLTKLTADLSDLEVSGIHVTGGASDIELTLPAPVGTVPVRIAGGAHKVVMHRPEGSTARIQVSGGASSLRFDGQQVGAVGGDVVLESGGFKTAEHRYDIKFTGGASSLAVDTR